MARNPSGSARYAPNARNAPPAQRPVFAPPAASSSGSARPPRPFPPSASSSRPPPPSASSASAKKQLPAGYRFAVEWPNQTAVAGYNTDYRPSVPSLLLGEDIFIGEDHRWMSSEWTQEPQLLDPSALYRAWIKIPTADEARDDLWFRPAEMNDAARHPEEWKEEEEDGAGQSSMAPESSVNQQPDGKRTKEVRGLRAMGTESGMFRTVDNIHKRLGKRAAMLRDRCDLATRLLQRSYSTTAHELNSGSVLHRIIRDLRPPTEAAVDMTRTWIWLRWGLLRSFGDFAICFAAHQRAVAVVLAYIEFVAAILPPAASPAFKAWAEKRANVTRRGLILAGDNIAIYSDFCFRLRLPTYLYVDLAQCDIPRQALRQADPPRCSPVRLRALNQIQQKALPIRYYPPQMVEWQDLERTGLGILPHLNKDEFERSDKLMSLKRRGEALDEQAKRQRVAEDRAVVKFQKDHPNFDESLRHLKFVTNRSPPIRRFLLATSKPRHIFAPSLLTSYAAAQNRACQKAHMLAQPLVNPDDPEFIKRTGKMSAEEKHAFIAKQKAERALVTFIPPLSVMTGSKEWSKTAQFVLSAVLMLRLFLKRVVLARTDSAVDRIGTQDWKQILGGQYFQHVWRVEETARHRKEHGDAGDVEARIAQRVRDVETQFAQRVAERRRVEEEKEKEKRDDKEEGKKKKKKKGKGKKKEDGQGEEEGEYTPQEKKELESAKSKIRYEEEERGVVHEEYEHARFWKYGGERFFGKAESDRLKSNPNARPELGKLPCGCDPTLDLIENDPIIVTGVLYLLNQLHLMHWISNLMDPMLFGGRTTDKTSKHHTFDVLPGRNVGGSIEWVIQAVSGKPVLSGNWPATGTPPTAAEHKQSLDHLAEILGFSAHGETLDAEMKSDNEWVPNIAFNPRLATITPLEREEHLMLRYYLTSFKCGQWPVEFHMRPPEDSFKCRKCRGDERPCETAPQLNPGMTERFQEWDDYDDLEDEPVENEDDDDRGIFFG
ncbi:hypothetical protein PENSPDRAFT_724967 [Peniophora sp. CONT]|nr:hypothetical protein PENSPDRAFT_724967 [Peniophora sp. CONT]